MTDHLRNALANHRAAVARVRELYPDESEDDLADSIAGESSLDEAIIATLRDALYREAQVEAIEHLIDKLRERQQRFRHTAQGLRAACLQTLQDSGLKPPLRAPDMTVSVGKGKPGVIITDPALVPDALCKIVREPSKTAIALAMDVGREVPGAQRGNGSLYLIVHRR